MKTSEQLRKKTKKPLEIQNYILSFVDELSTSKQGATKKFKYSPKDLIVSFYNYIEYNKNNLYFERPELIRGGENAGEVVNVKIPKPLTVLGYCLYVGISQELFYSFLNKEHEHITKRYNIGDYDSKTSKENLILLSDAITFINSYIKDTQISGGLAGVYNPMIVTRLHGLREQTENVNKIEETQTVHINLPNIDSSKLID